MTSEDIAGRRMRSQRLWGAPFATPEEVVGWLVAVQSQEFAVAKWAVAQRARAVTDAEVDRAFAEGRILRTNLLRPTWHFVLPADIRWLLALTAPRVKARSGPYSRQLGLDDQLFRKTNRLLAKAVAGGHRTRKELGAVLDRAGIDVSGLRLTFIVSRAELDAVICSGAPGGNQQTYASLDERAPEGRPFDRDQALARLAVRYFATRGPATLKDYSWWSGLTIADGKRGLQIVGGDLESGAIDGRIHWFAPSRGGSKPRSPVVDLIQTFDERVVSYRESRDVPLASMGTSFRHAVLLDGSRIGAGGSSARKTGPPSTRPFTEHAMASRRRLWMPPFSDSAGSWACPSVSAPRSPEARARYDRGKPMRFAIGVPTVRQYADPLLLIELARSSEEAGWDGFFVWDHLVYHDVGDPVADPWTALASIAALTRSIRLAVCMTVLARRRPWKVARETATLDVISGGRLVLGASLGSLGEEEFAAFGEDPDPRVRGQKIDEALEIIDGLWGGKPFSHQGRHYRVGETVFRPTPVQRPRIPIWIAGRWPARRPFQRAARWDGVFPTHSEVGFMELIPVAELRTIIDYTLGARGDRDSEFDVVMEGTTPEDPSRGHAFVAPYADAGLTWWVERLGWFRGSVDEMRVRVRAGPPRP